MIISSFQKRELKFWDLPKVVQLIHFGSRIETKFMLFQTYVIVAVILSLFSFKVMSNSFATSWTLTRQAPLSMGFSRKEYWNGLAFLSLGNLPDPGMEPMSPALQADSLPLSHLGNPFVRYILVHISRGVVNCVCKGAGSKYFRLCEPNGFCCNCSTLLLW